MSALSPANPRTRAAFLAACGWDVAVRKPGNVSRASAGHGMQAATFLDSAAACADALCARGAPVGARIEAAVAATWARVGCNTNLGILLLCAPIAAAVDRIDARQASEAADLGVALDAGQLRAALAEVLAGLDRDDAAAAFRAIVMASPGGLGAAPDQDVREAPSTTLREAMALAADRDRIARQYRDGAAELFELGLAALAGREDAAGASATRVPLGVCLASVPESATPAQTAAVQRVYLGWLASAPDSHIVRKHGAALAHSVLSAAAPWAQRAAAGENPDTDPAFAQWDLTLKTAAINPGTSADLTVATLMLAILAAAGDP